MLFSRGISLKQADCLALVPYADLLNHSPYSNAYFQVNNIALTRQQEVVLYADRTYDTNDQVHISCGLIGPKPRVSVAATCQRSRHASPSPPRAPQVLISYGQKSNAELLLLYGFVCDRNVFDEARARCGAPSAHDHARSYASAQSRARSRVITGEIMRDDAHPRCQQHNHRPRACMHYSYLF